jgi:serine/threonine protein kinase
LLPAQFTKDEDRLHRFEQEAYAASALHHPNIITIYEIGQVGDSHFIATEFIDGQTLRQQMTSGLRLSEALDVVIQVAGALTAAHAAGILHRDVKPENVMLRPDGLVKVLDFGLAKAEYVASEILLGRFYKRPGKWCGYCDYLPVCTGNQKKVTETLLQIR